MVDLGISTSINTTRKRPFYDTQTKTLIDLRYAKESDIKKVSSLQKIKDLCHALLRSFRLVSHVKKIKTRRTLYLKCTSSVNVVLYFF